MSYTYSFFTTTDITAPSVSNISPSDGSINVSITDSISFDITDLISGVDTTSVIITIDSTVIYQNESVVAAGWSVSRSSITNGYSYTCSYSTGLNYYTDIEVSVYAVDIAGNNTTEIFSFFTEAEPTIPIHSFNITSVATIIFPESKFVWNEFDEHALVLGQKRLLEEPNNTLKRRVLETFTYRANSTYRGLINGITRELGLDFFQPISINPKMTGSTFDATDPYIKFDGVYLYLYSDYSNELLDYKIDRFELGGNYEHLTRLVDLINTTTFFEASIINSADPYTKSMSIFNQSNRKTQTEAAQVSTKFKVKYPYMIRGTFSSNDPDIFGIEVNNSSLVNNKGKYYIDYTNGIITTYTMPNIDTIIYYSYVVYPFKPLASPVILHEISNENFRVKMFNQTSGYHGLPTELGVDILNELYSITPMYWGI